MPLRRQLGITAFGLNQMVLRPGERGRIHRHERQEEVYLVLEGTLTLEVEASEQDLAGHACPRRPGGAEAADQPRPGAVRGARDRRRRRARRPRRARLLGLGRRRPAPAPGGPAPRGPPGLAPEPDPPAQDSGASSGAMAPRSVSRTSFAHGRRRQGRAGPMPRVRFAFLRAQRRARALPPARAAGLRIRGRRRPEELLQSGDRGVVGPRRLEGGPARQTGRDGGETGAGQQHRSDVAGGRDPGSRGDRTARRPSPPPGPAGPARELEQLLEAVDYPHKDEVGGGPTPPGPPAVVVGRC